MLGLAGLGLVLALGLGFTLVLAERCWAWRGVNVSEQVSGAR